MDPVEVQRVSKIEMLDEVEEWELIMVSRGDTGRVFLWIRGSGLEWRRSPHNIICVDVLLTIVPR